MDSNKVTTVRSVFSELLEHEKISKSKLEAKLKISRKRISRLMQIALEHNLDAKDIVAMSEQKLVEVFYSKGHRKEFVAPDYKGVHEFLNPPRTYKNKPSLEQAWLELYVHPNFKVEADKLNVNYLRLGALPQKCMSLTTFKRGYKAYLCSLQKQYLHLSNTATIGESSPGAVCEIDGVGDALNYVATDGAAMQARVFCATLKYSGLLFAYACSKARTVDWAEFIVAAFRYFGGVPACIKSDNDVALTRREFVTTRKGKSFYTIKPNSTMKYLADAYSTDFILTNCASPREKGLVERNVLTIEREIKNCSKFKSQRFESLAAVNALLKSLCDDFNNKIVATCKYSHRAFFELYEKEHLSPLPIIEPCFNQMKSNTVSQRGYVRYLGHDYFVGTERIGTTVYCIEKENDKLEILEYLTLNTIVTYTIDKTPCIRVKRIKAPQFLTEKERAVSRTLDEYVEIARTEHPTVAFSLTNLIRHIFSNLNLNDVDRNQLCNRILQHCKRHVLESESLTNCMCYIISNQISTSHKILELLNQAVSANRRTVQITPKHDLKQEIAKRDDLDHQSSNVRGSEYYEQRLSSLSLNLNQGGDYELD